jgi:hypothetical protein
MNEPYVDYELAKLLKEKGFDEPCNYFFKYSSKVIYFGTEFKNSQIGELFFNAPTIRDALKWLKKKYGIYASPIEQGNSDEPPTGQYTWCVSKDSVIYRNHTVSEKLTWADAGKEALKFALINVVKAL